MEEIITLAGGCFWCTHAVFDQTKGVKKVTSGFAGGSKDNPTYEEVATGQTDYKEAVQITYNPEIISTHDMLQIYFRNIDPTDDSGQFVDRGPQYTTAVYYHTPEQQEVAQQVKKEVEKTFDETILTPILKHTNFVAASENHQDFYKKHPFRYKLYKSGSGRP